MQSLDELICSVIRGENPPWPSGADTTAAAALVERIDIHGVAALLHEGLSASDWPAELLATLRGRALAGAIWELRHQQVVAQALAALVAHGILPVLIKGTALAYSLYGSPAWRSRGDTDLIVPAMAKDRTQKILSSLGFEHARGMTGEYVSYQSSHTVIGAEGGYHSLDLHWKINNSELLSRLFTYEELRDQARPLPLLSPHARAASPVHALLLACMHRSTHKRNPYYVNDVAHFGGDRLIWLYDIHLLSGGMTPAGWQEFLARARAKGLLEVCLEGMQGALRHFRTTVPEFVMAALAETGSTPEPVARYMTASKSTQQWMDFRALDGAAARLQFIREVCFPPAHYMHAKYPSTRIAWLPWLYLKRAAAGVAKGRGGGRMSS